MIQQLPAFIDQVLNIECSPEQLAPGVKGIQHSPYRIPKRLQLLKFFLRREVELE